MTSSLTRIRWYSTDSTAGAGGTLTDNGGGNYTATDATAQKKYTNSNERIGYSWPAIGGRTVIDNALNVDFRGSWTQGYDVYSRNYNTTFADQTPLPSIYSTANAAYRSYNTPGVDLTNPSVFNLASASNLPGRSNRQGIRHRV